MPSLISMENLLGLILAILIIFQLLPNVSVANSINNPIGIILSLILVVILFVLMNPIVGFLFLIYLYEIIQISNNYTKQLVPITRNRELVQLNQPQQNSELEEIVIRNMAPIKNEFQGNNVSYTPILEKLKMSN
jgi:predicted membrane protein